MFESDIKSIKAFTKKIRKSKKKALKFLVDAGICTPTGKLRKPYK